MNYNLTPQLRNITERWIVLVESDVEYNADYREAIFRSCRIWSRRTVKRDSQHWLRTGTVICGRSSLL